MSMAATRTSTHYIHQAVEGDHAKRAAILAQMQQMVRDKAIYAPIWQLGFLNGVGPRIAKSGLGRIPGFAYTAPYEESRTEGDVT